MQLSKIECIVKPFKLEEVKEALIAFGVTGMTVSEVMGMGRQRGPREHYRGVEYRADLVPKLKIEVLAVHDQVAELVELIAQAARTGNMGDGMILVSRVESITRIRSGETGIDAL
jgi:nitrogen regulatory protein P-II 1